MRAVPPPPPRSPSQTPRRIKTVAFMVQEERSMGKVEAKTYYQYLQAGGLGLAGQLPISIDSLTFTRPTIYNQRHHPRSDGWWPLPGRECRGLGGGLDAQDLGGCDACQTALALYWTANTLSSLIPQRIYTNNYPQTHVQR